MARRNATLRYAELEASTSAMCSARSARACAGAASCVTQSNPKKDTAAHRNGEKTLARLEARMAARATRAAMRDALDLLRQQELRDNIERRAVRTQQRRWFVLGRALDAAIARDLDLRQRVMAACDGHLTREDERRLLNLAPLETQP